MSDSCKKKLLELIYWLPKLSQYLLTKLAILILTKNVSFFCKTQVIEIVKMRVENDESQSAINHSDYVVFLMNLFNGYLSFDLLSLNDECEELLILDVAKFENHKKLCMYLESSLLSHKNHRELVDLLISMSIPIFSVLKYKKNYSKLV